MMSHVAQLDGQDKAKHCINKTGIPIDTFICLMKKKRTDNFPIMDFNLKKNI